MNLPTARSAAVRIRPETTGDAWNLQARRSFFSVLGTVRETPPYAARPPTLAGSGNVKPRSRARAAPARRSAASAYR